MLKFDPDDLGKYGAPYILTDRGNHYYKTLIKQYLSGRPVNDDTLLKLFGLGIFAFRYISNTDVDVEMQIIEEIKEKLHIDMLSLENANFVKVYLYSKGYVKENPDYDENFNNMVLETIG